jgi:hypothetical protein
MRRTLRLLATVAVAAAALTGAGLVTPAEAAPPAAAPPAAAGSAAVAAASGPLTCNASSQYYTYAVSGTLTMPNVPGPITVVTTHRVLVVHYVSTYTALSNVTPVLDNTFAGGYYSAQGLNAWDLGVGSDNAHYWMLLPKSQLGAASSGSIVAQTTSPVAMSCSAPAAVGNTGAFTCTARYRTTITYTITGTVVAPATLVRTTLLRNGAVVATNPTPSLESAPFGALVVWDLVPGSTNYALAIPAGTLSASFSGYLLPGQLPATCSFTGA